MEDVNISLLREFSVLAQTLNFTKASSYLNLTQASLSKHLKSLESAVGVELIERDTNFVALTDAGLVFLEESHNAIEAYERAVQAARKAAANKPTTISVNGSFSHGALRLFTTLMAQRKERGKRLNVKLDTPSYPTLQLTLDNDESDVFVLLLSDNLNLDGYEVRPLFADHICAIFSADHPLTQRDAITLDDLSKVPIMLSTGSSRYENKEVIEELFRKSNLTPQTKLRLVVNSDSYFDSTTFDIINLIPNYSRPYYVMLSDPSLACRTVDGSDSLLNYAIAYRKDSQPEVVEFVDDILALELPEGLERPEDLPAN
ncbi:LysR family transcriptional regulator [uncultured Adlercreutzia sp.]|uniref:LysR family transcriptional regulator n=1 Tax=uncultured Adlercreutzia sp. TaxID=875803 RepID=UPI0026F3D165|nr:LysR family transcriptional regulator [uncultured Adlercreutzia sp.]